MKVSNKIVYTSLTLIALFSSLSYAGTGPSAPAQCPHEIQFSSLPARFNDLTPGIERFANPGETIQVGQRIYKLVSVSLSKTPHSPNLQTVINQNHLLTVDFSDENTEGHCIYTKNIYDRGLTPVEIKIKIEK